MAHVYPGTGCRCGGGVQVAEHPHEKQTKLEGCIQEGVSRRFNMCRNIMDIFYQSAVRNIRAGKRRSLHQLLSIMDNPGHPLHCLLGGSGASSPKD